MIEETREEKLNRKYALLQAAAIIYSTRVLRGDAVDDALYLESAIDAGVFGEG